MAIYSDSGFETGRDLPSIRPTLDLNFAATKTLDRRITFSRDSLGTYTDELGVVRYVPNNVPRFDHDPATGESLGLLVEESRTNLLTYSDLTSGEGVGTGWANGGSTVSKGSDVTAPDGTVSAWNTVYNGTSGDASLYKNGGEVTTSNSTVYTCSVWAKVPSTNTYITGVRIRTFNDNHSGTFNLLTGTVVGTAEGTTTNRIESYPNGWYRCSITFTSGTDGDQGFQFYLINNSSTSLNSSGANGEALYLWGAQLEEGSFATSYIPTSGSTVTRAADFAKITETNFIDFYNQDEGTVYVSQKLIAVQDTSRNNLVYLINGDDGGTDCFYNTNRGNQHIFVFGDGGTNYSRFADGADSTDSKTAWAYDVSGDDFKAYYNGIESTNETDNNTPSATSHTQLELGAAAGDKYCGHISYFKYYPKRLSNAQLQSLTS